MFRQYVSSKINDLKYYLETRRSSWPQPAYYFGQTNIDAEAKRILESKDYTDEDKQLRDMLASLETKLKEEKERVHTHMTPGDKRGMKLLYKHVEDLINEIKSLLNE